MRPGFHPSGFLWAQIPTMIKEKGFALARGSVAGLPGALLSSSPEPPALSGEGVELGVGLGVGVGKEEWEIQGEGKKKRGGAELSHKLGRRHMCLQTPLCKCMR